MKLLLVFIAEMSMVFCYMQAGIAAVQPEGTGKAVLLTLAAVMFNAYRVRHLKAVVRSELEYERANKRK